MSEEKQNPSKNEPKGETMTSSDSSPKQEPKPQEKGGGNSYTVGDISNSTGIAIGEYINQNIHIAPGPSRDEIVKVFTEISEKIAAIESKPKKAQADMAVKGLMEEANNGDNADEATVSEWMNMLAQAASDAFEVAVAAFANPIAGLGLAFKKIADRAKQEKGK